MDYSLSVFRNEANLDNIKSNELESKKEQMMTGGSSSSTLMEELLTNGGSHGQ